MNTRHLNIISELNFPVTEPKSVACSPRLSNIFTIRPPRMIPLPDPCSPMKKGILHGHVHASGSLFSKR